MQRTGTYHSSAPGERELPAHVTLAALPALESRSGPGALRMAQWGWVTRQGSARPGSRPWSTQARQVRRQGREPGRARPWATRTAGSQHLPPAVGRHSDTHPDPRLLLPSGASLCTLQGPLPALNSPTARTEGAACGAQLLSCCPPPLPSPSPAVPEAVQASPPAPRRDAPSKGAACRATAMHQNNEHVGLSSGTPCSPSPRAWLC